MAIDFPASPTVGQQYTYNNVTYMFTASGIWAPTGGKSTFTTSPTPPLGSIAGDFWYNLNTGILSVFINDGNTTQWVQVSPVAATASIGVPTSGQLRYVSAVALTFVPYNGNQIKINGIIYPIPNTGINLSNTGVMINGNSTPGNLAANAPYLVYIWNNAGTLTVDFRNDSTHGPSTTAGNEGVEVAFVSSVELPTRTLIGLIRTDGSSQFRDSAQTRYVASWNNRRPRALIGTAMGGSSTAAGPWIDVGAAYQAYFVTWAPTAVPVALAASQVVQSLANATNYLTIYLDSSATIVGTNGTSCPYASTGYYMNAIGTFDVVVEGFHTLGILIGVTGGTGTYYGGIQSSVFI